MTNLEEKKNGTLTDPMLFSESAEDFETARQEWLEIFGHSDYTDFVDAVLEMIDNKTDENKIKVIYKVVDL